MDLSFGEQVKILLKRNNMTIRELAEIIERKTGMKMTRQNLTQRLVRDNFKEQDMRMIASVLHCNLTLTLWEAGDEDYVPYTGPAKKEKEDGVSFQKVVDEQLTIDDIIKVAGEKVYPEGSIPEAPAEPKKEGIRERARRRLRDEEEAARLAREEANRKKMAEKAAKEKERTEEEREDAKEIARRALEATHSESEFRRFGMTGRVAPKSQTEEVPAAEDVSWAEDAPVFEEPVTEDAPAFEEAGAVQEESVMEEAKAMEEAPAFADAGAAGEAVAEDAEAAEEAVVVAEDEASEEAFATDEAEPIEEEADPEEEKVSEVEEESALEEGNAAESENWDEEEDESDDDETEIAPEDRMTQEEIDEILNEGKVAPPKDLMRDETLLSVAKKDSEARAAMSNTADMGVIPDSFRRTSVGETAKAEINPYTGEEYESNVVRRHPRLTGYIQVYDREEHKWIDMTEWAFLGFQERKKMLLGADYKPPIYLE
jgi:hypothetical protein